jgi:hypothetical protein
VLIRHHEIARKGNRSYFTELLKRNPVTAKDLRSKYAAFLRGFS